MKTIRTLCQVCSILLLLLSLNLNSFAQDAAGGGDDGLMRETMNDLFIVGGAGAGGAILGLSILSFYAEPGDHLKNIIIGGAIGVIVGVGVVAYNQATKSKDSFYEGNAFFPKKDVERGKEFALNDRVGWHREINVYNVRDIRSLEAPQFLFSTTF